MCMADGLYRGFRVILNTEFIVLSSYIFAIRYFRIHRFLVTKHYYSMINNLHSHYTKLLKINKINF